MILFSLTHGEVILRSKEMVISQIMIVGKERIIREKQYRAGAEVGEVGRGSSVLS